ncbi:hypothetical protein AFAE65S_00928 [Alcaligenes phenolicus]
MFKQENDSSLEGFSWVLKIWIDPVENSKNYINWMNT